ncbi:MAG: TOBE domain-containing protein [Actinobacteria bacterium]|nr:TOBE domain-containing protein [Actinomycetota bacterium]
MESRRTTRVGRLAPVIADHHPNVDAAAEISERISASNASVSVLFSNRGALPRAQGATGQVHAASYHGHDTVITATLDTGEHVDVRRPGLVPSIAGDRVRVLATGRGRPYPTPQPHAL